MCVFNCYYIIDSANLSELVIGSDSRGADVEYLKISMILSKKQFLTHSQYCVNILRSVNDSDGQEWSCNGRSNFKYIKLELSTLIEAVVSNNAWVAPTT
jgi:hypothetical protein